MYRLKYFCPPPSFFGIWQLRPDQHLMFNEMKGLQQPGSVAQGVFATCADVAPVRPFGDKTWSETWQAFERTRSLSEYRVERLIWGYWNP